ncbi:transcription antitermination factor NusB [Dethiothermospora halolimnae]|uniref:transcription antitermination factor NusB n=1 Tax=Dethiothermospora halolimnae TaxID=3114390 RepID=UPI003CCBA014
MGRRHARESTMKLLFQMGVNENYSEEEIETFIKNNNFRDEELGYIRSTARAIIENLANIDEKIQKHSKKWKINRIAKVDLAIIRIAVYEILYKDDIPFKVSINEALEIGKKYSTDEAGKFINGILGSLVRTIDSNE